MLFVKCMALSQTLVAGPIIFEKGVDIYTTMWYTCIRKGNIPKGIANLGG